LNNNYAILAKKPDYFSPFTCLINSHWAHESSDVAI
jgi:hypothetical protein